MAMEIEERLFALQDKAYRDFHKKLVPTVPSENIIGVRTPALRKLAKEIVQAGEEEDFLDRLPHRYFDENQLHAFIISDEDFDEAYLSMVAEVRSEEYYVNMMIAWYFATALAKQYEAALPFIEGNRLAPWTHNKAIQKAIESRRVSAGHKEYLRRLKVMREQHER